MSTPLLDAMSPHVCVAQENCAHGVTLCQAELNIARAEIPFSECPIEQFFVLSQQLEQ